jgi:hypothetical protein
MGRRARGCILAADAAFVLLTFGSAIGLAAASPSPNSGLSTKVIASLAVFWVTATQIGAFMAGGYIAGRKQTRQARQIAVDHAFEVGDASLPPVRHQHR